MKRKIYIGLMMLLSIMASITLTSSCQKMERPDMTIIPDPADDGAIKILAIGNSFSEDALETHLYELAKAADVPIIIGNLYIGGASLAQHEQNVKANAGAYSFRKISRDGTKTTVASTSIARALSAENWTHISFQQVSQNSGQFDSYQQSLPVVYDYVKPRAKNDQVKFILHQTWAYAQNSTHDGFVNYDKDQLKMYNAIVDAVNRAKELVHIDLVVPAGTAIQNVRTSVIGDNLTRDGYHLDPGIGKYTAACTWFEALTGKSVVGNTYRPAGMSAYEAEIAQHAAHTANTTPLSVTDMIDYKDWGGSFDFNDPIYLDFGQNTAENGWNGITSFLGGYTISNLKDTNGEFTGISFIIDERFNGINTNGPNPTSTDFDMPKTVAANSYYGNAGSPFNNMVVEKSVIRFFGLDKDKTYDLCYFGSRDAVGDNRETYYTAKGKNEATALLNTSNNSSTTVCTNAIQPDDNGEITITIGAGSKNNNGNKFYYITALRIKPTN